MNILKWYIDQFQSLEPIHETPPEAATSVVANTRRLIPPILFPVIADLGAGAGTIAQLLVSRYKRVYAVDFRSVPHGGGYSTIMCDLHKLAEDMIEVDGLLMNHTFEHLYAPYIFCCEAFCTLLEKGRWLINLPEYDGLHRGPTHHHPSVLAPDYLERMFENTGFKILNKGIRSGLYWDYWYLLERQPLNKQNMTPEVFQVLSNRIDYCKNLRYGL